MVYAWAICGPPVENMKVVTLIHRKYASNKKALLSQQISHVRNIVRNRCHTSGNVSVLNKVFSNCQGFIRLPIYFPYMVNVRGIKP